VYPAGWATIPLSAQLAERLRETVLYRIARGDADGRPFGTPRNPRLPTIQEYNPRIGEVAVGGLQELIVARKHGIFPDQAELMASWSDDELLRFRLDDPVSAVELEDGLSLTGGHHRVNEIVHRVQVGKLDPKTPLRILIHD
jgi:hypothetical protein